MLASKLAARGCGPAFGAFAMTGRQAPVEGREDGSEDQG
jgi:hypothetical protein